MPDDCFQCRAEAAIGKTAGFRSAPAARRARATFEILGVPNPELRSVVGAHRVRPALRVEDRCGTFGGPFSILLQDVGGAWLLDERAAEPPAWPGSALGLHRRSQLVIYSRQINSSPTNDRLSPWRRVVSDEMPETVTAQIGRNIMMRRTSLGMLQGELAQKAGMSQAHLSNIEQGKRSLTVEVLAVFASVLDCEMADLLPASRAGKRAA